MLEVKASDLGVKLDFESSTVYSYLHNSVPPFPSLRILPLTGHTARQWKKHLKDSPSRMELEEKESNLHFPAYTFLFTRERKLGHGSSGSSGRSQSSRNETKRKFL